MGGGLQVAFNNTDYKNGGFQEDALANTLTTSADRTRAAPILAVTSKDYGQDVGEVAPTMRAAKGSGGAPAAIAINMRGREGGSQAELAEKASVRAASGSASRSMVAIPIQEIGQRQSGTSMNGVGHGKDGDPSYTLQASSVHGVAVNQRAEARETDQAGALTATRSSSQFSGLRVGVEVRKITPLECERLQGFPDLWTDGFKDSVRYRMAGNAVAVVCADWIGRRLRRFIQDTRERKNRRK